MNWGLVLLGTVIVLLELVLLSRSFWRGEVAIQQLKFVRTEKPALFWTGILLHFAYLVAGLFALKVGLGR